ncbi:MAG: Ig-like domain-containing protein [Anaerolineales bacterium]
MRKILAGMLLLVLIAGCNPESTSAAPVSWIDQPLDGSSFEPGTVEVLAHASSPGGVSQLRLSVDGVEVESVPPEDPGQALTTAHFTWDQNIPGSYTLQVSAQSSAGVWGTPAEAIITIAAAVTPTPVPSLACSFTADGPTTIYTRPSLSADVFYEAPAGFEIPEFQAQTSDGWLGFDPAIAQAANTGPFRLRWIPPTAATVSGDCSGLPVVWGPPPGICFLMPMGPVDVHDAPDAAASVVATLTVDDYVAIDGVNAASWYHVDFSPGNTGLSLTGWISPTDVNWNGPCEFNPPTPTPVSAAISSLGPDSPQVYSGIGACSPKSVTFNARAANPAAAKVVVFFYRLQDVDSGEQSDWSPGQAMQLQGGGNYSLTLTGSELAGSAGMTHARVRYQFALQLQSGEIVRSPVYEDVELGQCGVIRLPPIIRIGTPTPTPIIIK